MDLVETEPIKQALTSRGALLGQQGSTPSQVMETLQELSTSISQLSIQMDHLTT